MHAPPGTGVAEVFGDLVAAIVTERARRIADLPDPAAAFGPPRIWGVHSRRVDDHGTAPAQGQGGRLAGRGRLVQVHAGQGRIPCHRTDAGSRGTHGAPKDTEPRWIGMPLRVVRGQDRGTVDRRNDLAYDGLLIAGRD